MIDKNKKVGNILHAGEVVGAGPFASRTLCA